MIDWIALIEDWEPVSKVCTQMVTCSNLSSGSGLKSTNGKGWQDPCRDCKDLVRPHPSYDHPLTLAKAEEFEIV